MNNVKRNIETKLGTNRTMTNRAQGAIFTVGVLLAIGVFAQITGGEVVLSPLRILGALVVLVIAYVFCPKE